MTETASFRKSLCVPGKLQLGSWALRTSDRGGQDKNRKVRTVGLMRNSVEFRLATNIANVSGTLPFSTTHNRSSTFDTLWRER